MNVSNCLCPLRGPGHDTSVGEWIYLTVCVLSVARVMIPQWENECISLSVLSMNRVMIAQWENECISLSVLSVNRVMIAQWENECISLSVLFMARVQFPAVYLKVIFPWLIPDANPSWASVAENGSPQWHDTSCGHRGGTPLSNHGQTMAARRRFVCASNFMFYKRIVTDCWWKDRKLSQVWTVITE